MSAPGLVFASQLDFLPHPLALAAVLAFPDAAALAAEGPSFSTSCSVSFVPSRERGFKSRGVGGGIEVDFTSQLDFFPHPLALSAPFGLPDTVAAESPCLSTS